MGKVKDAVLKQPQPEEGKSYDLTEYEAMYIARLNNEKNQINGFISGFLSYVAGTRLGYKTGENLQFEVDFDNNKVTITKILLPETTEGAQAPSETSKP